jgi:hypothetical protein
MLRSPFGDVTATLVGDNGDPALPVLPALHPTAIIDSAAATTTCDRTLPAARDAMRRASMQRTLAQFPCH